MGILREYEQAAKISKVEMNHVQLNSVQKSPEEGKYKINQDATIFNDRSTGLGAVMRDNTGDVLVTTCFKVEGSKAIFELCDPCANYNVEP